MKSLGKVAVIAGTALVSATVAIATRESVDLFKNKEYREKIGKWFSSIKDSKVVETVTNKAKDMHEQVVSAYHEVCDKKAAASLEDQLAASAKAFEEAGKNLKDLQARIAEKKKQVVN